MSRPVFALLVPALVVVLCGIVATSLVASGFAGETCRFDRPGPRWADAGGLALAHLLFAVLFALALVALSAILGGRWRRLGLPQRTSGFEGTAMVGLLLMFAGVVVGQLACRAAPYDIIATGMTYGGAALLAAAIVWLGRLYLKGLAADRPTP